MTRTVRQKPRKEKVDVGARSAGAGPAVEPGPDDAPASEVALIQALIPVALDRVRERLLDEVTRLAGPRYARHDEAPALVRWGTQGGSVYLADQKVRVAVPRVRDRGENVEVPLTTYQALQQPQEADRRLLRAILGGLSTREYARCTRLVPEAFGLSASTVSRRFRRASQRYLQALQERPLGGYAFVALVLDGKTFADDAMVLAVGITLTGEKVLLGVVQTATENRPVCAGFLRTLLARGLTVDEGLLVVLDGAKGLAAAVAEVFGDRAVVQRCQWHKRENVVRHLPKGHQAAVRRQLQAAYDEPTYAQAKRAVAQVRRTLTLLNRSAAASLDEGLEETLTLHRLGVFRELGTSLKTTNLLESINARLASRTDKVDHWRNSDQKHRWVVTALLDLEPTLHRIKGYRALPRLQAALKRAMGQEPNIAVA